VEIIGRGFLPVQALNELRRNALEKLEAEVLGSYWRECGIRLEKPETVSEPEDGMVDIESNGSHSIHVLLSDPGTLSIALRQKAVSEIQIESDGFLPKSWKQTVESCHRAGKRCVLVMPVIFRTEAKQYFEHWKNIWMETDFDGIMVRNLEEADYLKQCGWRRPIYGDHNLYCFNHKSAAVYRGLGLERLTYPLELNSQELGQLAGGYELVAYGYLPAMVSAQCIQKTTEGCTRRPGFLHMKDRTGKELLVKNHCVFCYNTIYNPSPLSLLGQEQLIEKLAPAAVRLQFTKESEDEVERIIKAYIDAFCYGNEGKAPYDDFTRGHFKRGVE